MKVEQNWADSQILIAFDDGQEHYQKIKDGMLAVLNIEQARQLMHSLDFAIHNYQQCENLARHGEKE